jgi:NAD+ kinase
VAIIVVKSEKLAVREVWALLAEKARHIAFLFGSEGIAGRPEVLAAARLALEHDLQPSTDEPTLAQALHIDLSCRQEAIQSADVVVAFGGDGTILSAARTAAICGKPVLGVNFGQLGFLAEVSSDELEAAIRRLALGDYEIERRHMLEAQCEGRALFALNDIVIRKESPLDVLRARIYVDGERLDDYVADGLLFSTSTGSTAYSLSCGGPIVSPGLELIIFTPICPHSLRARPVVLSENQLISAQVYERSLPAIAIADGREVLQMKPGQALEIQRAPFDACLIRLSGQPSGFFTKVHQKLVDRTQA